MGTRMNKNVIARLSSNQKDASSKDFVLEISSRKASFSGCIFSLRSLVHACVALITLTGGLARSHSHTPFSGMNKSGKDIALLINKTPVNFSSHQKIKTCFYFITLNRMLLVSFKL